MRTIAPRWRSPGPTVAWLAGMAVVAAACSDDGGKGGKAPGTALMVPTAFQVHGQLSLTPPAGQTYSGLPAPPTSEDFLLHVDPGAPSVLSFSQDVVGLAAATTDGLSFQAGPDFRVGLPGPCGSSVDYSSFRFSADATAGTLTGTAAGTGNIAMGDEVFVYTAALTFTGTRDPTGPAFDRAAVMDPFHPGDLRASRPLPASATAALVASGESIGLVPIQTSFGPLLGFSLPAGVLPRYGAIYDVVVTPWQDLAGNPGAPSMQLATRAAPLLVAREDFENPAVVSGDGVIVDDTVLPPIAGQRSAVLMNDPFQSHPALQSPHITAHLQVAPGSTVVRFAVRPFSYSAFVSTWRITMQAGVPGGAITSAVLPPQETITSSAPSSMGSVGLGEVRTVEIPLPAGTTSDVILDLDAQDPPPCGPPQSLGGYLVDDLRVE